jgi:hypothetical protein
MVGANSSFGIDESEKAGDCNKNAHYRKADRRTKDNK